MIYYTLTDILWGADYARKNWSGWCNVVLWTTPEQCCYQGSTTLVELTVLMSIVRSIVVRCWQRTIFVTMLLEQELAIVDEKSLLIVVNNDWTMVVEGEQLNNGCWQQLTDRVQHDIVDSVQHNTATSCWHHWSSCSFFSCVAVHSLVYYSLTILVLWHEIDLIGNCFIKLQPDIIILSKWFLDPTSLTWTVDLEGWN